MKSEGLLRRAIRLQAEKATNPPGTVDSTDLQKKKR
jgi:hypothetical protein